MYGEFQRGQRWRDRLSKKVAHKALDIASDDDMNVNVRNGWGWKEIVAAGAVATVAALGWQSFATDSPPAVAPVVSPAEANAIDRDTTRRIVIEKFIPSGDSP